VILTGECQKEDTAVAGSGACVICNARLIYLQVKNHMWIFVNSLIENPTFDSQTKENMTLQAKSFGSTCKLSEKFIKGVSIAACG